ncbi:signal recognition particle subunit SRP68-like [Watersipora subatra]|uniref:signal recognition particle subunit SRP68-like n=1 Tax=Watersipora subatra TaxID=2589382 RepID=UPI00355C6211
MADGEEGRDVEEVPPTEQNEPRALAMEVLAVIKESQQQHGLRHGDYQRYRTYCSRRLRRIRKCVSLAQGVRQRFLPKHMTAEQVVDERCLYIPLVEAERCWSYAMQLKAESLEEHRKKHHMVNKLRKAERYAQELSDLCDKVNVDPRTKLEVQAYKEWMSGTLHFELKQWNSAMELLTRAKVIYEKMCEALSGDAVLIYKQKVTDIEPSIRYCAYNIGDTSAVDDLVGIRLAMGHTDTVLDELIQKSRERQAGSLHEVTWRGRVMSVKSDKVRVFLLAERESEEEVKAAGDLETKITVYDRIIKDCIESLQVIKEDLKSDPTFRQIQRGQEIEGRVPLQIFLHTYLQYIKIKKTIQRYLVMIELYRGLLGQPVSDGQKVIRPQDIARLYEMIIQGLGEMISLPGLQGDAELEEELQADIIANKAFRCYYLAKSFAVNKQWPEVVALTKRSKEYIEMAQQRLASQQIEIRAELEAVLKQIDALLIQTQASSILDSSQDLSGDMAKLSITADKRVLIDRLDEYLPEDPKVSAKNITLIKSPPLMQPIPCKPMLYDLAGNHLQLPNLSHKVETQQRAGLSGFVKSWIGGWGGKK